MNEDDVRIIKVRGEKCMSVPFELPNGDTLDIVMSFEEAHKLQEKMAVVLAVAGYKAKEAA